MVNCRTSSVSKPSDIFPTMASTARTTVPSGVMEHDELLMSSTFDQETSRLAGQMLAVDAGTGSTLDMTLLAQTFAASSSSDVNDIADDLARCRRALKAVGSRGTKLERKLRGSEKVAVIAEETDNDSWAFGGL